MDIDRERLIRFAYGMLGSRASAEDVVQEAWIRLQQAEQVREPDAWMRTVVGRLALDELRSARVRRETYVGPWLPELLVADLDTPDVRVERDELLSLATLSVLEHLSPAERCAFLLREMFDLDYPEIAGLLERTEPATRQLVARSKRRLTEERPRYEAPDEQHQQLLAALSMASTSGDLEALKALLVDDVQFVSDGGGKALAAMRPILGREAVARFLIGLLRKFAAGQSYRPALLNGHLGVLILEDDVLVGATAFCIAQGRVTRIYALRNPDKLERLLTPGR